MAKITWIDKTALHPAWDEEYQFTADNANETKASINDLYDAVGEGATDDNVRIVSINTGGATNKIKDTLDEKGFYKGMIFIDDMVQFCGKTYKVFKRVNKLYMHRDKQMQKCRGVVLLDGVLCHGYEAEIDCDRTCFFFWKEAWLEKIE